MQPVNHFCSTSVQCGGARTFKQRNTWISQLEWALCTQQSIELVKEFQVIHDPDIVSNHAPISIKIQIPDMSGRFLLERAKLLGEDTYVKAHISRKPIKSSSIKVTTLLINCLTLKRYLWYCTTLTPANAYNNIRRGSQCQREAGRTRTTAVPEFGGEMAEAGNFRRPDNYLASNRLGRQLRCPWRHGRNAIGERFFWSFWKAPKPCRRPMWYSYPPNHYECPGSWWWYITRRGGKCDQTPKAREVCQARPDQSRHTTFPTREMDYSYSLPIQCHIWPLISRLMASVQILHHI